MPSNAYHLKFELYSTPDPTTATFDEASETDETIRQHCIWIPAPGSSVFDDLPDHKEGEGGNGDKQSQTLPIRGREEQPNGNSHYSNDIHTNRTATFRNRSKSVVGAPLPSFELGIGPNTALKDWRFGRVRIASFDMEGDSNDSNSSPAGAGPEGGDGHRPAATLGPVLGGSGQSTRARFSPLTTAKTTEAGWGIVHLYREGGGAGSSSRTTANIDSNIQGDDEEGSDGTILCIPAVPSYLTPRDFLGFVGETWSRDVSHYRMVMTSRTNRYMVLLKFRDAERAREWRSAFDGRVFNSMEAEICHVTFIRSITIETPGRPRPLQTIAEAVAGEAAASSSSHAAAGEATTSSSSLLNTSRPFPPPTPNLIELPTCPVCLERMDDTNGLMTILCQHVFHCTCLQTWKGSGCPVCRATNPSPMASSSAAEGASGSAASGSSSVPYDPNNPFSRPFGDGVSNLCSVCDCPDDLWICLICGYVGCGRYKRGHAKDHWKETAHMFSLELETQHVWDYAEDTWVHRLIRNKGDGKVVELPGRSQRRRRGGNRQNRLGSGGGTSSGHSHYYYENNNSGEHDYSDDDDSGDDDLDEDVVPRAKLDNIGMEYTHLLTSQLESQRVYFEEMVNKAADKAAKAAAAAESASAQTTEALRELRALRTAHDTLAGETVPALERDVERERRRGDKAAELARTLGKSLQEEKRVSEGLMARIKHMQEHVVAGLEERVAGLQAAKAELEETNHDLTMFISSQEKLRELEAQGQIESGEVAEGTASVPEEKKGKGRGKGRKR